MTRRQTGAPGLPPRQPAGAQSALVIQEPRVSAEAKSRRQLAARSVVGGILLASALLRES